MTSKLTRERIELIANFHRAMTLPPSHSEIEELARMALAALDSEPVAYISKSDFDAGYPHILARRDFNKACTMPVYAAQPAPVVPEEKPIPNTLSMYAVDAVAAIAEVKGWNACRAALLERQLVDRVDEKSLTSINPASDLVSLQKKAESIIGNYPGIPDGYVMVPMRLTAENGAKGALSGEFSETKFVNCPECFGDNECETCDGSGKIEITVPVTWTTIKAIWVKGVEHFAVTAQEND